MAELFWSYWDASVRFGLLAIVLLVSTPLLKRWISPNLLCWAWALLILRLALPLALPFSGSIFNLSENLRPSNWTDALRSGVVDAGLGETILPKFRTQDEAVIADVVGFSWENALVLLWVLGIVGLLVGLVVNAIRLHRFFDRATRHNSGRLYEIFKDTRRRFGIHANVPLLVSPDIKTPGIAGIFNPRIVIPQVCAEELSDEEIRCVLLHELTHYRRGDLFMHHLLLIVSFVHWYNPLVWLVFREFKIAMEQACDADVVDSECIDTVQQYGYTLLHVMQRSRSSLSSPAGALCLLGNRKNSALKERIHLIAVPRKRHPLLIAAGLSMFGLSFVYAITGEEVMEHEAQRLFSLTKFSGPIQFISKDTNASQSLLSRELTYETAQVSSPHSWVQDVDVTSYRGQQMLVRVTYHVEENSSGQKLWLNVLNQSGTVIASERTQHSYLEDEKQHVLEVPVNFATSATEMVYGMSSSAHSSVWVERIDFLPLVRRSDMP